MYSGMLDENTSIPEEQVEEEKTAQDTTKELIFKALRVFMVVAAMMVCLGHGANDVSNSISPLVIAAQANGSDGKYPYYVGATGIALGLLTLGKKVMETVGKNIIEFDFAKGYCA
jgi:inorganic phosphate transporter, PiT family